VRARDFLYLRLILIETRFLELAFWTTHPRNLGYFLSVVSTHSEYASDILPALTIYGEGGPMSSGTTIMTTTQVYRVPDDR
jgi:hypothetical protein